MSSDTTRGMIEQIPDMPPGTLGFRASGHVTRDDYTGVFLPPVKQKVELGEEIRMVYQVGPGFEKSTRARCSRTRRQAGTSASSIPRRGSASRSSQT